MLLAVLAPIASCSKDPESVKRDHLARGNRYVEQNKLAAAVIEYRNAINTDARYGEARYKLGETYERLGDGQKAFGEFVRAADLLSDKDDVQLKVAQYLFLAKRFDDAKRIAEALLKKNGKNLDAKIVLANAMAGLKDVPAAMTELESAIQLDPKRVDTYLNLASCQGFNGNPTQAEAILREALVMEPGSVNARLALVRTYGASGDLVKAEAVLKEAVALQPTHAMATQYLAALYLRSGRTSEAEAPLRVLAGSTKTAAARLALAEYYLGTKRSVEAISILDALVKEPEGRVPASVLLARGDYVDGRKEEAHKRLGQRPAQEPTHARLLILKAQFLRADGRYDEAIERLKAAATAAPQLPAAQYAIGLVCVQKKNPEQALKAFNEALNLNPQSAESALQVARLQLTLGRADLALPVAEDLVRKQAADAQARIAARLASGPATPAVLELAGRAYMSQGDAKKSEQAWRKLIEVQPTNMVAYAARGQLFYAQGRLDDARRKFERYVEWEPANVGAHTLVGILLQMQNRLPEAQKKHERVIENNPNAGVAANNLAWLYADQNARLDTALQLAQTAEGQIPDRPEVDDTLGWVYDKKGLATLAIASF